MPPEAPKSLAKPTPAKSFDASKVVSIEKSTPGTKADKAKEATAAEKPEEILIPRSAKTAALFSPENKGFFSKMSKGGKDIANGVFAKLYEFSAVKWLDRGVKHVEVAFQQLGKSHYEEKAVKFKTQMDILKMQADTLEASKEQIKSAQQELIRLGAPGAEGLELQLKKIDKQKADLQNKGDKMQSKFEATENVMKNFANKRDRVAEKLINDYSEKLKPMEKELAVLETHRNEMNLVGAVAEARHKKEGARLDNIEKKKIEIETALQNAGVSPRKIRKSVSVLEDQLKSGRSAIMSEQEEQAKQMEKINKKIAKVDAKANPYRDKREEFVRIKEDRPINIDVPTRVRGAEYKGTEETKGHTRGEVVGSAAEEKKPKTSRSEGTAVEAESGQEVGLLILAWNAQLKETFADGVSNADLINKDDFTTQTGLASGYKLDTQDFKNILGFYYDVKKMPKDKFNGAIFAFEEKVSATK